MCDHGNHVIRKITAAGVVTTLAGSGTGGSSDGTDGTGVTASFHFPSGISVDGAGTVYVADTDNQLIRTVSSAGVVTTIGGFVGQMGATNGVGSAARFFNPKDIAVGSNGDVYVVDRRNFLIRKGTR